MAAIALALPDLETILDEIFPFGPTPYEEGRLAAQLGVAQADNPYTHWSETDEAPEWDEGYNSVLRDRWAAL